MNNDTVWAKLWSIKIRIITLTALLIGTVSVYYGPGGVLMDAIDFLTHSSIMLGLGMCIHSEGLNFED